MKETKKATSQPPQFDNILFNKRKGNKSFALMQFELQVFAAKRAKYPEVPYLTAQRYDDSTANGLTKCIIDFLKFKGWQAERINTTGRPIDTRQTFTDAIGRQRTIGSLKWGHSTSTKGSADISATIAGRSVKIEVKIGKDRQSEAQRLYQKAIEEAGGMYVIAKDFERFYEWYKTFDVWKK